MIDDATCRGPFYISTLKVIQDRISNENVDHHPYFHLLYTFISNLPRKPIAIHIWEELTALSWGSGK